MEIIKCFKKSFLKIFGILWGLYWILEIALNDWTIGVLETRESTIGLLILCIILATGAVSILVNKTARQIVLVESSDIVKVKKYLLVTIVFLILLIVVISLMLCNIIWTPW